MIKRISIEFEFDSEQVLNLFNYSDSQAECIRNISTMMHSALNYGEHDNEIATLADEILNCNPNDLRSA